MSNHTYMLARAKAKVLRVAWQLKADLALRIKALIFSVFKGEAFVCKDDVSPSMCFVREDPALSFNVISPEFLFCVATRVSLILRSMVTQDKKAYAKQILSDIGGHCLANGSKSCFQEHQAAHPFSTQTPSSPPPSQWILSQGCGRGSVWLVQALEGSVGGNGNRLCSDRRRVTG